MDIPKHQLEIEWLYDSYDCEVCGPSDAQGAIVRLDGKVVIELIPNAHCYSSETYDDNSVYATIFNMFNIELSFAESVIRPGYEEVEGDDDDDEAV